MASVAGAIANEVGRLLSERSPTVIVENGGDVWALSPVPLEFLVYPGEDTPFSGGIPFTVGAAEGVSVCTSSGRVGPSFSMGRADSVTVIHRSGAVADAAATSIANRIRGGKDITPWWSPLPLPGNSWEYWRCAVNQWASGVTSS